MPRWYVLNTKPKKESQVERLFIEGGFTIYWPKYLHEPRIGPFFPGYAFLRFEFPEQYQMVKYTRGVKRVVGNDAGPTPIPDETVDSIRARERDGLIVFEKYGEEPAAGDEIEVVEGPLKGLKGVPASSTRWSLTKRSRPFALSRAGPASGSCVLPSSTPVPMGGAR